MEIEICEELIDEDVPSITEQAAKRGWKCAFYDFGKATQNGVRYFNCTIIDKPDGEWLVTRRAVPWPRAEIGMNDLVAFRLGGDRKPLHGVVVNIPRRYKEEHFEDPRVMRIFGRMAISCTNFEVKKDRSWTGAHQILTFVDDSWKATTIKHPMYGKNRGSIYMMGGQSEKNWTWFDQDGRLFMVYMTQPHEVVEFNELYEPIRRFKTFDSNELWTFGQPRGGSPPVRVGDEYWSFFHSSTLWINGNPFYPNGKRRYHMGAYAFEAKPPFRVTRMTTVPLLSGSKADPWSKGLPLVVFPGGALLRNGVWTVVMGVNDFVSAWVDIPHGELIHQVRMIPKTNDDETVEIPSRLVRPATA